ncbi:MAG: lyase family protein [Nitrososphaerales archaeon]
MAGPSYSELVSPTDFRYSVPELFPFLSEDAYVKYKGRVEAALARQLAASGICSEAIAREIESAASQITAEEVYAEERRIKHDIRALVNIIRDRVSNEAKPFVHLTATSYDIVDTANAMRIRDAISKVVIPDLIRLESALIEITLKYAGTTQIGRTHGQHAEPITLGFFTSFYVSRLGQRIYKIINELGGLTGKFAGAVGVYGPLSLMVKDPEVFEKDLLASLDLKPSEVSTQIVQPEPLADLMHSLVSALGVIANFARDIRHLQRTEIAEVSEEFSSDQVGSSTMPQKRNPISFENVESLWKKFMPQMVTVYMDQISEHQRDLTNSLSQRYIPELIAAFDYAVRRLTNAIWNERTGKPKITVDLKMVEKNLEISGDKIASEPLYILLSLAGHPDAHESVRKVVQEAILSKKNFLEVIKSDQELEGYLSKIPSTYQKMLENPAGYRGIAMEKSVRVAESWKSKMEKLSLDFPK